MGSSSRKRPQRAYIRTGIGGAGNFHRIDDSILPSTSSIQALSTPDIPVRSLRHGVRGFSSGIGGAGNWKRPSQAAMIDSREAWACDRVRAEHASEHYFFGIGGAGNNTKSSTMQSLKSASSTSTASVDVDSIAGKVPKFGVTDAEESQVETKSTRVALGRMLRSWWMRA